jgi:hypothetical protein
VGVDPQEHDRGKMENRGHALAGFSFTANHAHVMTVMNRKEKISGLILSPPMDMREPSRTARSVTGSASVFSHGRARESTRARNTTTDTMRSAYRADSPPA